MASRDIRELPNPAALHIGANKGCVPCRTDDRQPGIHISPSLRPGGDAGSMASRDIRELEGASTVSGRDAAHADTGPTSGNKVDTDDLTATNVTAYGPVQLDMSQNDFIGCIDKTNNTGELSAVPHAIYRVYRWRQHNKKRLNLRHKDWTHVVMVYDSICARVNMHDGPREIP